MTRISLRSLALVAASLIARTAAAQTDTVRVEYSTQRCPSCAEWNAPHKPLRIFGNTYYVGMEGVSAILVTSDQGHVLIDGGIPMSAPQISANIAALGFRVADVKLILNSHAHHDHAGGIAQLQRMSGATVAASPWSAKTLERGESDDADPQYGLGLPFPQVKSVRVLRDSETVHVGPIALTAHLTAGHTPGGTSWTWRSCEAGRCADLLYADSQTPISADGFKFTNSLTYPSGPADFERGLSRLGSVRCDILLTPHPSASRLFERMASGRVIDPALCRQFVDSARQVVARRMSGERGGR